MEEKCSPASGVSDIQEKDEAKKGRSSQRAWRSELEPNNDLQEHVDPPPNISIEVNALVVNGLTDWGAAHRAHVGTRDLRREVLVFAVTRALCYCSARDLHRPPLLHCFIEARGRAFK